MAKRILLFLSETCLHVWAEDGKRLAETGQFKPGEEGEAGFRQLVEANPDAFYSLLTDLVEEDFKVENIPHVSSRDQKKLISRKLEQLYRATPYRASIHQGREKEGRREDRMLFAALANPTSVDGWLNILTEKEARLVGVYSVALLLTHRARKLVPGVSSFLLVTLQSDGGLRQTYLANGALRFSRLTTFSDPAPAALATAIASESVRARQFLASTRSIGRDEKMQVVMLTGHHELAALREGCHDTELIGYDFLVLPDIASRVGASVSAECNRVDELLLKVIQTTAIPNQYAPAERRKFYRTWQLRTGLDRGAAATLLLGLAVSAYLASHALSIQHTISGLNTQINAAEAEYQKYALTAAPGEVTPEAMKNAVLAHRELVINWPSMTSDTDNLARVMDDFSNVQLDSLTWGVRDTPEGPADNSGAAVTPPPAPAPNPNAPPDDGSKKNYVVMTLRARIQPFANDWRGSLALVERFSAALKTRPEIIVTPVLLPIDPAPEHGLKLDSKEQGKANGVPFALRVAYPLVTPDEAAAAAATPAAAGAPKP